MKKLLGVFFVALLLTALTGVECSGACGESLTQALGNQENMANLDHDWLITYSAWFRDGEDWKITATRTCQRKDCDGGENGGPAMETETATATAEVTAPATCIAEGVRTWTAVFENTAFKNQTRVESIPPDANAHAWNEPTYTWSDDDTTVTATAICGNDTTHQITECVHVFSSQTKAPTYFEKGVVTCTATFDKLPFATQTKVIDVPALERAGAVRAVEAMIAALSDPVTLSDEAAIVAAREAYEALSDKQKETQVDPGMLEKLIAAERQLQAVKQPSGKAIADQKAADEVKDAIASLSASGGSYDKPAVTAARAAYENLSEDQKQLIDADVLDILIAAEEAIEAAEKAAEEEAARREAEAEAARIAAEEEAARKEAEAEAARIAAEEEAARKEAEAEAARIAAEEEAARRAEAESASKDAEEEAARKAEEEAAKRAADEAAAKAVVDAIRLLSDAAGLDDRDAVAAARAAYEALSVEQKALVPGDVLARLATAEQQVEAAGEATRLVDIRACSIAVKDATYTGKEINMPSVTVSYGGTPLKEGTDYALGCDKKIKAIGAYRLTVSGMGGFTGAVNVAFKVTPRGTAFVRLTGGERQITIEWNRRKDITGYEIEYSLKKDFSGSRTLKIKKAKTLTATVNKLKARTKYYVRIRTYTMVNKKKICSAWSRAWKVKTKGKKAKNETIVPGIAPPPQNGLE